MAGDRITACALTPKAGQESGEAGPQRDWDAEWRQSGRDYLRYREAIDLTRFLLQQRYYFVDAVRRVQADGAIDDKALKEALSELSPDNSRYDLVSGFLKSEHKRPWP
jgi:hypothetical protein